MKALSCGPKYKRFREFRTPFPLRDIREYPRNNVRACAAGDGAICSKNRKIVLYHGANPNTRNGARLRSPSLIMVPGKIKLRRKWSYYINNSLYLARKICSDICHQTKSLMSRTIAVHVHYNSWYISLPSSAK